MMHIQYMVHIAQHIRTHAHFFSSFDPTSILPWRPPGVRCMCELVIHLLILPAPGSPQKNTVGACRCSTIKIHIEIDMVLLSYVYAWWESWWCCISKHLLSSLSSRSEESLLLLFFFYLIGCFQLNSSFLCTSISFHLSDMQKSYPAPSRKQLVDWLSLLDLMPKSSSSALARCLWYVIYFSFLANSFIPLTWSLLCSQVLGWVDRTHW
jgi:hypothetical protein